MRKYLLPLILILAACSPASSNLQDESALPSAQALIEPTQDLNALESAPFFPLALTQQNPSANRYVPGQIDLAAAQVVDIPLDGKPSWVLGIGLDAGRSLWLAVLNDGRVQAFEMQDGAVNAVIGFPESIEAGQPPTLAWVDGEIVLLNALDSGGNALNHPLLAGDQLLALDEQGRLWADGDLLAEGFLLDGRILSDGEGRILLLSQPSSDYEHGILGDTLESKTLTLFDLAIGETQFIGELGPGQVFEAIMPIWADLDQDGQREILVTASDSDQGAQLKLYAQSGELLAQSDPIGQGNRWRNQAAIAPFGPNGEWEVADVRIPHINGVVEFFSWQGDQLDLQAAISGYTSHVLGRRNLDMALAADVNADGQVELLLPSQNLRSLAAIQHQQDGAAVVWELELGTRLSSNIASARFADGELAIGIGLESGVLRVWLP